VSHRTALRETLANVPLFAGCSTGDLRIVARHMQVVHVPEGTVLMREGDRGDAFYVVLTGRATMVRARRNVGVVRPGDHVGELALLDPAPRSATVTAVSPMLVGVLDAGTFSSIIRDMPALSTKLLGALARRLRERDREATAR